MVIREKHFTPKSMELIRNMVFLPCYNGIDMSSEFLNPVCCQLIVRLELIMLVDDSADAVDSLLCCSLQLVISLSDEVNRLGCLNLRSDG